LKVFASVTGVQRVKQVVKIHHNYAAVERHFGEEVIVHRKGANSARKGQLGIIPGSMGTPSYIVEGLGNPESFMSCSHGCGRLMSRKEANRVLDEKTANESMRGIFFTGWKGDYSEAPAAYKDIETVLANQSDLVKPMVKLHPLGVMKG
jgi:tRNA-splicing ligase RtcB